MECILLMDCDKKAKAWTGVELRVCTRTHIWTCTTKKAREKKRQMVENRGSNFGEEAVGESRGGKVESKVKKLRLRRARRENRARDLRSADNATFMVAERNSSATGLRSRRPNSRWFSPRNRSSFWGSMIRTCSGLCIWSGLSILRPLRRHRDAYYSITARLQVRLNGRLVVSRPSSCYVPSTLLRWMILYISSTSRFLFCYLQAIESPVHEFALLSLHTHLPIPLNSHQLWMSWHACATPHVLSRLFPSLSRATIQNTFYQYYCYSYS